MPSPVVPSSVQYHFLRDKTNPNLPSDLNTISVFPPLPSSVSMESTPKKKKKTDLPKLFGGLLVPHRSSNRAEYPCLLISFTSPTLVFQNISNSLL